MKRNKILRNMSIVLIMILVVGYPSTISAAKGFTDVNKGSSHYDSIYWLVDQGISGYEDNTFGPYKSLTREHAAIMFVKALDLKLPAAGEVEKYFDDISASDTYAKEIAATAKAKIFNGDDGKFNGDDELSREQMATTLVNAYKLEPGVPSANINLKGVGSSHRKSVQVIADLGITSQLADFKPRETIVRGQFATFLYNSNNVDIGGVPDSDVEEKPEPEPEEKPGSTINYDKQSYNYNFSSALSKQMALSTLPQTDVSGAWYDASKSLTQYYMNPTNFDKSSKDYYQFLVLSGSSKVSTSQLNKKVLQGKGMLEGRAAEFKKASKTHNVNEIYLVSHALLETGNGSSTLAKGVEVGKNKSGKPVRVTSSNRKSLKDIKKTYNFFGIGAVDSCPLTCGSERAYSEGWFTPASAIVGGAKFINNGYVSAGQDTIYKMRWNPAKPATHQYATDAGWAVKQTANIERTYDLLKGLDGVVMNFEEPSYKKQPAAKKRPTGAHVFNVNTKHAAAGKTGTVNTSSLNFRSGPSAKLTILKALPKGTHVAISGEHKGWYKVKVGKQYGWVSAKYIDVKGTQSEEEFDVPALAESRIATFEEGSVEDIQANTDRVIAEVLSDDAIVYEEANKESNRLVNNLLEKQTVEIIAERTGWFKVIVGEEEGWMPTESLHVTNVTTVKADTVAYDAPNGEAIEELLEYETVVIVPDEALELTQDDDWYEIYYHGQVVWIHSNQLN